MKNENNVIGNHIGRLTKIRLDSKFTIQQFINQSF